ncbi:hypothetical protein PLICRDRAFT_115744 [Plicaturopsis crispa FD-325 SS-3]|nr:hypothetical protein PLICRDRAFT_115744 [Plicaturopsis crispa FD-325 SS-3]
MNSSSPRNATTVFNPTSTKPPFFQIIDPEFLNIIGSSPSIHAISSNASFAFAHEAPIWVEETDEIFFASQDGGYLGFSDWDHNSHYNKLNLGDVEKALKAQGGKGDVNIQHTDLNLDASVQMPNGGTGPYKSSLLLVTSGRANLPPSLVLVNPKPPYNTTVLLDNYYGRQFNSFNDIKIHDGKFFITDPAYGWLNGFRPKTELPSQVYRLDPETGRIRVVADQFVQSNGIAFDKDGKIAYITDTGLSEGFRGKNSTRPATIYQYDVTPTTHFFTNRRTFAHVDTGLADGIQVDAKGYVYGGCGDGVQVWNPEGTLIGKFFLGTTSANMAFAGPGRLVILAETNVYLARIAANGFDLSFP